MRVYRRARPHSSPCLVCRTVYSYAFIPPSERSSLIKAAVIGATGFTGALLARMLQAHPEAEASVLTSSSFVGRRVDEVFPEIRNEAEYVAYEPAIVSETDVAFVCYPHTQAHPIVAELRERGVRVVDLSADFRLPAEDYPEWYGFRHPRPDLVQEAVYGLPVSLRESVYRLLNQVGPRMSEAVPLRIVLRGQAEVRTEVNHPDPPLAQLRNYRVGLGMGVADEGHVRLRDDRRLVGHVFGLIPDLREDLVDPPAHEGRRGENRCLGLGVGLKHPSKQGPGEAGGADDGGLYQAAPLAGRDECITIHRPANKARGAMRTRAPINAHPQRVTRSTLGAQFGSQTFAQDRQHLGAQPVDLFLAQGALAGAKGQSQSETSPTGAHLRALVYIEDPGLPQKRAPRFCHHSEYPVGLQVLIHHQGQILFDGGVGDQIFEHGQTAPFGAERIEVEFGGDHPLRQVEGLKNPVS